MSTARADSWDRLRQSFADQFEPDGTNFVYRRSQKGEAIRVSAEERSKFIDEFDRNVSRAKWMIYIGMFLGLGAAVLYSLLKGSNLLQAAIFAGIGAAMVPYFVFYRWAWAAPARELAGRMPVAGERAPDEVRRLRFRRITYGQLAGAAAAGFALPFLGSARQDVFSGWNRLWLAFGGAIILLAAVQAFRKWRIEQQDSYAPSIDQRSYHDITAEADQSTSPTKAQLWRYVPLAVFGLAGAFIAFTSAGKQLARKPSFWPIVMIGVGGWSLFTVARGFATGQIEPFVRGFSNIYERESQPKRFWASMAWNSVFACLCFWVAFEMWMPDATNAVQDTCYNEDREYSARDAQSACEKLVETSTDAINRHPANAGAYLMRGSAYAQMGETQRALADFSEAIRLEPNDAQAYIDRGYAYEHIGDLPHAIADLSSGIRLKPDEADAYYYRWAAYKDLGDDERAAADLATLNRLDPKFAAELRSNR